MTRQSTRKGAGIRAREIMPRLARRCQYINGLAAAAAGGAAAAALRGRRDVHAIHMMKLTWHHGGAEICRTYQLRAAAITRGSSC